MNRPELIEELTQDIFAYVMQGGFPPEEFAASVKPRGLDERFNDFQLLMDLHFILKDDVVKFVEELPQHLRQIRTETESVVRERRGTVDGHINWGATIKRRNTQNPLDNSLFLCENRSEDYDIGENLVLKKLLAVIHQTLTESEEYLIEEYEWVQQTWKGNQQLIEELSHIVERNVHVRRIRDPETYEPTERMMTAAENARQPVYRDAAELIRARERLLSGDPEELQRMLETTAITPDDENRLFELFVLFRFVETIERLQNATPRFNTIATDRQEIARFEGEKDLYLYHDNSASDRDLSFLSEPDAEGRPLTRAEKVQEVALSIANNYFRDRNPFRNHTGRPDMIVLEIVSENDHEYLIAEVKNSINTDTIRKGIKETLEYLAFLRFDDEFVFGDSPTEEYFGSGWNGLLIVQDLDEETATIHQQSEQEIKILQAEELERELTQILMEAI